MLLHNSIQIQEKLTLSGKDPEMKFTCDFLVRQNIILFMNYDAIPLVATVKLPGFLGIFPCQSAFLNYQSMKSGCVTRSLSFIEHIG